MNLTPTYSPTLNEAVKDAATVAAERDFLVCSIHQGMWIQKPIKTGIFRAKSTEVRDCPSCLAEVSTLKRPEVALAPSTPQPAALSGQHIDTIVYGPNNPEMSVVSVVAVTTQALKKKKKSKKHKRKKAGSKMTGMTGPIFSTVNGNVNGNYPAGYAGTVGNINSHVQNDAAEESSSSEEPSSDEPS